MAHDVQERIQELIQAHPVLLFMKGNRLMPMCGFSARAIRALELSGASFETVDVLEDQEIREGIKLFSNWPTIPQLYVGGEFIGGSDIIIELYENGELRPLVSPSESAAH